MQTPHLQPPKWWEIREQLKTGEESRAARGSPTITTTCNKDDHPVAQAYSMAQWEVWLGAAEFPWVWEKSNNDFPDSDHLPEIRGCEGVPVSILVCSFDCQILKMPSYLYLLLTLSASSRCRTHFQITASLDLSQFPIGLHKIPEKLCFTVPYTKAIKGV